MKRNLINAFAAFISLLFVHFVLQYAELHKKLNNVKHSKIVRL